MHFVAKRFSIDRAERFKPIAASELAPYSLLPVPIYLMMARNAKFLCIKRAFDFFSETELTKLEKSKNIYYLDFIEDSERVLEIARKIKSELSWMTPKESKALEPAPYELSHRILLELSKIWRVRNPKEPIEKQTLEFELFYAVILSNEVCKPLPVERLVEARDRDFEKYELGLLRSGLSVFLAMHVGLLDLPMLSAIRERVFLETVQLNALTARANFTPEIAELVTWVREIVNSSGILEVRSDVVEHSVQRFSYKIRSRLLRMKKEDFHSKLKLRKVSGGDGFLSESEGASGDTEDSSKGGSDHGDKAA